MSSTNIVVIDGHLGSDPELRHSNGGASFLEFSVAVKGGRKDKATGAWVERADWIDCLALGASAEHLARMLRKGSFVVITGSLQQETWEKDGKKQSRVRVIVNNVQLGPRTGSAESRPTRPVATAPESDDNIPF